MDLTFWLKSRRDRRLDSRRREPAPAPAAPPPAAARPATRPRSSRRLLRPVAALLPCAAWGACAEAGEAGGTEVAGGGSTHVMLASEIASAGMFWMPGFVVVAPTRLTVSTWADGKKGLGEQCLTG